MMSTTPPSAQISSSTVDTDLEQVSTEVAEPEPAPLKAQAPRTPSKSWRRHHISGQLREMSWRSVTRRRHVSSTTHFDDDLTQPTHCALFCKAGLSSILPIVLVAYYALQDWENRYCENDLALWVLYFGWVWFAYGVQEYMVDLWYYRYKWSTAANDAEKEKIASRHQNMKMCTTVLWSNFLFVLFIFVQIRLWSTHACGDDEYERIVTGAHPVWPYHTYQP